MIKRNFSTITISIIILLIITFLPPLLGNYGSIDFFDLKDAGPIGDALGGITAPFLSGLAAILVFIAFNEQVKANNIFKRQENLKMVIEQFRDIKTEHEKFISKLDKWQDSNEEIYLAGLGGANNGMINDFFLLSSDLIVLCDLLASEEKQFKPIKTKIHFFYNAKLFKAFKKYRNVVESYEEGTIHENYKDIAKLTTDHINQLDEIILNKYRK